MDQVVYNVDNGVLDLIDGEQNAHIADVVLQSEKVFQDDETVDVCADGVVDSRIIDGFDVVLVESYERKLARTEHARRFEVVEERAVQIVQQYVLGSYQE